MSRFLIGHALGNKSTMPLTVGVELAKNLNVNAHVIHSDKLADYDTLDSVFAHLNLEVKEHYVDNILSAKTNEMQKQVEKIAGSHDFIKVEARSGMPSETLIKEAKSSDVELIVLGHDPHKGFVDMFLGRVTEAVVHRSNKSVLIVKNKESGHPKKVMVAYDFTYHCDAALDWAKTLGKKLNVEVHLVNVVPCYYQGYHEKNVRRNSFNQALEEVIEERVSDSNTKLSKKAMEFSQENFNVVPKSIVDKNGSVSEKLKIYVEENDIDMVIMGAHSKGKISELFLGSVTSKMLKKSPVSILIAK